MFLRKDPSVVFTPSTMTWEKVDPSYPPPVILRGDEESPIQTYSPQRSLGRIHSLEDDKQRSVKNYPPPVILSGCEESPIQT